MTRQTCLIVVVVGLGFGYILQRKDAQSAASGVYSLKTHLALVMT